MPAFPPPFFSLSPAKPVEKQETTFSCRWPLSILIEVLNFSVSWTAYTHVFALVKTQFSWYLNKNFYWTVLISQSSALTARCPSVIVAVAQMSRFKGSGLGATGVPKWNLPPCGPGDFVWEHVCTAAARKDSPASSPYINYHMSSSLNKMECLLCFPWTLNYNKSI